MSKPYELRVLEYLENYREVALKVKELARRIDPNAEVYAFGSTVRGKYTALSDIDILLVVEKLDKKYEIMARIYKETDAPIELHVVTKEIFEKWYKRFIKPEELTAV